MKRTKYNFVYKSKRRQTMSKTISARIDDTMHTMITDEANHEGITVNEKLKEMLNGHFNGEEKKEIPQSHNIHLVKKSVWEKTILENQKNQENKLEEKINQVKNELEQKIKENTSENNQRFTDHLHNHADKKWHNGLKCNSS